VSSEKANIITSELEVYKVYRHVMLSPNVCTTRIKKCGCIEHKCVFGDRVYSFTEKNEVNLAIELYRFLSYHKESLKHFQDNETPNVY
jgi:hypothetical protein